MTQPLFDDGAQRAACRPRMSFRPRQQLVPDVECSLHLDHITHMRRHAQVAVAILPIFSNMALPDSPNGAIARHTRRVQEPRRSCALFARPPTG